GGTEGILLTYDLTEHWSPSGNQRSTNSCVRPRSISTNRSWICPRLRGWSKMRRIVCFPGCAARQPSPRFGISADSIGWSALSEVTSTLANCSRSNQASSKRETDSEPELIVCLRIGHPLQYRQRQNITQ